MLVNALLRSRLAAGLVSTLLGSAAYVVDSSEGITNAIPPIAATSAEPQTSAPAAGAAATIATPPPVGTGEVGRLVRLSNVVLPGSELEAFLAEGSRSPATLRIASVHRHGTAFRYDFEFCGLEPRTFDLREFLKRKDGSSLADLSPIRVEVRSRLPPGQVQPHLLEHRPAPAIGGYENLLFLAAAAWVVGLAWLVRRPRVAQASPRKNTPPPTLAERLRPAVEEAVAGRIDPRALAELERMLLAYWRQRLHLEEATAEEALAAIRKDDEGGRLLRALEAWLHAPEPKMEVPLEDLLAPYQHIPAPPPTKV